MTPEELDEARGKEAVREMEERNTRFSFLEAATIAARKAREGWTPPEPVDPDILAFREWAAEIAPAVGAAEAYRTGLSDNTHYARCFLAGARMAAERERERAKVLVEYLEENLGIPAHEWLLAKYRGEAYSDD